MESWKDIEGYEGMYQISNEGRVKSLERQKEDGRFCRERLLKQTISDRGYCRVGLQKGKKLKVVYVHRLVAEAFIPNPDNLPQVNHKDESKLNNSAQNLEWCTAKDNNNYGTKTKRARETKNLNILKSVTTEELIEELKRRKAM